MTGSRSENEKKHPSIGERRYDSQGGRLIYVAQAANSQFWDGVWEQEGISYEFLEGTGITQWAVITQQYLKPDVGPILEGGCGRGQHVAALKSADYEAIGVDFAAETVATLNRVAPKLDIRFGDVRSLDFPDEYFAGYWSLGVIEHFAEGYTPISSEMWRVLKREGYLFLVFPYMNPIRRFKAWIGRFPKWEGDDWSDFYQFALDQIEVRRNFESLGFVHVASTPVLGRQGLREEMPGFSKLMDRLYRYKGRNFLIKVIRRILHEVNGVLLSISGYSILLVFRKPN